MYFKSIGHSLHNLRRHRRNSPKSSLLDLIILNDLRKAHISNLINPIMTQYILSLEVSMNNLMTMQFLKI